MQNLYVRILLLQTIKEVPIYAKIVRDMCIKKLGRNPKHPPIVYVGGKLSALMLQKDLLTKYDDPSSPTIIV